MAKHTIEPGQRYRDVQLYGRSEWIVEDLFGGADGIQHARLVSVSDPSIRKTLSTEVLADPARFQQV